MSRVASTVIIVIGLAVVAVSISVSAAAGDLPATRSAESSFTTPEVAPASTLSQTKKYAKRYATQYAKRYASQYAKKYAQQYAIPGPAGPKGDPGPAGPKGDPGPASSLSGMVFYAPGPQCPTGTSAVSASNLTVVTVLGTDSYGTATLVACKVG